MIPRILLCLALLTSSSCAYMASRQTFNITSNPPGASLFLIRSLDEQAPGRLLGTTPYQKGIQQGLRTEYLRANMDGYEPAIWELPNALRISHHFELERAISEQVAGELATYPKEYVRGAVDVLGKCDEVLAAPYMLRGTTAASANTANESLKLDYPDLKASVLARELDRAIDELQVFAGLSSTGDRASTERGAAARAEHLISEIKQGLGVR